MAIKVLIVDDHIIFIQTLSVLFERENGIRLVGQTGDSQGSIQLIKETSPDVVVLDLVMPGINGIELTRQIRSRFSNIKVICLSMHSKPQFVRAMINAGASGYVLKNNAFSDLVSAIQTVYSGRKYFSKEIQSSANHGNISEGGRRKSERLSAREKSVLCLIAEGNTNHKISSILGLSIHTIIRHRQNIMNKIGLRTTAELTRFAVCQGLMPP
ncbi:MAG: response regulator transcription factor [Phycisphaerales bacterium]